MAEDAGPTQSISARIAALKINELGRVPGGPPLPLPRTPPRTSKPDAPPPFPSRPQVDARRHTANAPPIRSKEWPPAKKTGNQPIGVNGNGVVPQVSTTFSVVQKSEDGRPALPPRLPPRRNASRPSPPLPPRKLSEQTLKSKKSVESLKSTISTLSTASAHSTAPTISSVEDASPKKINGVVHGPRMLPAIPARRSEGADAVTQQPLGVLEPRQAAEAALQRQASMPALPPRLSARRETSTPFEPTSAAQTITKPKRSALSFGMNPASEIKPALPSRKTDSQPITNGGSLPSYSAVSVSSPSSTLQDATSGEDQECLKCRDFSAADEHAARFTRESLPSTSTEWLAHELTHPFSSLTDKARAIFTWLHHNIEYDVHSFFNNSVKGSTPASTLSSGLAVCSGYAGLFTALATHAGLESVVISGHGKGYGHSPLAANSGIPPYSSGHAWNGVKIDGGRWKLIDCCWGAGHINGRGQPYTKRFAPSFFTMDNDQFGRRHFPENPGYFFRSDARSVSWEEYITADAHGSEGPQIFSNVQDGHGLDELSFRPALKHIPLSSSSATNGDEIIRFQFTRVCEHWQPEKMGKGESYLYIIAIKGRSNKDEDQKDRYRAFQNDGRVWWCDVPREELGWEKGQNIMCCSVTTVNGEDARGLTYEKYQEIKGRVGMSFGGIAQWELS